jgi:uncharacterized protein YkvS
MSYVQFTVTGGKRLALSAEDIVRILEDYDGGECEVELRNGNSYDVDQSYDDVMALLGVAEQTVVDRPVRRING